jgi:hypothetical protein
MEGGESRGSSCGDYGSTRAYAVVPADHKSAGSGSIKSDWIESLKVRASDILRAFTSDDTGE